MTVIQDGQYQKKKNTFWIEYKIS